MDASSHIQSLLQRGRAAWRQGRDRVLIFALEHPAAAAAGALVVGFLVVAFAWALLAGDGPPNPEAREVRMLVACSACGFREQVPLSELRGLEIGPNGLMVGPRCGRPAADRYRRGAPPAEPVPQTSSP